MSNNSKQLEIQCNKRFALLDQSCQYLQETAVGTYGYLKATFVPSFMQSTVNTVEQGITNLCTPVYELIQPSFEAVVQYVDKQVDCVANAAEKVYIKQKDKWNDYMDRYQTSKDKYSQTFEQCARFVKENGIMGAAAWMVGYVSVVIENILGSIISTMQYVWNKLNANPQVSKMRQTAQPSVEYVRECYDSAHEMVVKNPKYAEACKRGQQLVNRVRDTGIYRSIQPYVDPAMEHIQSTQYYNQVIDHMKPIEKENEANFSPPTVTAEEVHQSD